MAFSDTWEEITAQIKEQADIVQIIGEHVNLKRSGVRHLGLCPFHGEKTPSFSVHGGQQFFYCFGCGESGDVFTFMMKYHHLDFPAALKMLAQRFHIELPQKSQTAQQQEQQSRRKKMFELNKKAAQLFRRYLLRSPHAEKARTYLHKRTIKSAIQEKFLIGYAPDAEVEGWNFLGSQLGKDEIPLAVELGLIAEKQQGGTYDRFRDRIIFPIFDARGRIAGFGGRIVGNGNPKYLNSPESPLYNKSRLLFGLYQQRDAIRVQRKAVLVEGNFDLLALVAHGLDPVAAPLGTALTREQVRQLKPLVDEIILLFDGDEAGVKAAERAVSHFLAEQVSARVVLLPDEHDPDTFVQQKGLEALKNLIEKAETLPEFVVDRLVGRHGLSLDGKSRIIEELEPLMNAATAPLQRSVMAAHFATILGVDPEVLMTQLTTAGAATERSVSFLGHKVKTPSLKPLDGAHKRLISFAVLNPEFVEVLDEAGLGKVLGGTIGEVIFLQLKILFEQKQGNLQPEELLSILPEGEERALVASLLIRATAVDDDTTADSSKKELEEIVLWLRQALLKQKSDQLMKTITEAQKNSDFGLISELLQQKMQVDSKLKSS